jgi:hypothetical protein
MNSVYISTKYCSSNISDPARLADFASWNIIVMSLILRVAGEGRQGRVRRTHPRPKILGTQTRLAAIDTMDPDGHSMAVTSLISAGKALSRVPDRVTCQGPALGLRSIRINDGPIQMRGAAHVNCRPSGVLLTYVARL